MNCIATRKFALAARAWLAGAIVLLLSTMAFADAVKAPVARSSATQPATATTTSSAERIAIPARTTGGSSLSSNSSPLSGGEFSTTRVLLALAVVLAAIFLIRWAARGVLGLPTTKSAGGAIQVLSRTMISPKQQLMLVQVGRRVVLVANCGAQMNSLCEITDEEEIASLVGQLHRRPGDSTAGSFLSLFGRAGTRFADEASDAEGTNEAKSEMAMETSGKQEHEALVATRHELGGLLERVRSFSRGIKRT